MAVRVLDSSLLIEAERRKLLKALQNHLLSDRNAITPERVYEETVAQPASAGYQKSASQIEELYKKNAIRIENPDYNIRLVSDAVDRIRKCIASKANKPEHLVERADLDIVALAITHASKGNAVELIFRDNALRDCLEIVLPRMGISKLTLIDSSEFVLNLPLKKGR